MHTYDLIKKKRDGGHLTKDEITYIVDGYTKDLIPDYQMSAFLMSVYFQGMDEEETLNLTMAMAASGEKMDLSKIDGIKVDKHSTGGVGDKTSLLLAPMVAACGVPVAKMSGRGLGHTGGTIDKLESFKGFTTEIEEEVFIKNVNENKIAIAGQTANLAPADKKIYALRDVTATVENLSLIASSIMSKKIASGSDAIVLDVKTGDGAFMKTEKDAYLLGKTMVKIGKGAGRDTVAVITDMNQPLGYAVGNVLEVKEAISALNGEGPDDLLELCYELGSHMLVLGKCAKTTQEARAMLVKSIDSRSALKKMAEFVRSQGGEEYQVYHPEILPCAKYVEEVRSLEEGYVHEIKCEEIGLISLLLGGGRETKDSTIDLAVGLILNKKVTDYVGKGDILGYIHGNDINKVQEAKARFASAFKINDKEFKKENLIRGVITS